jgi:hypothetical protein
MAAGDSIPWKLLVPPGLALLFGVGALWATCGGDSELGLARARQDAPPERPAAPPPRAVPPGLRRDLAQPRAPSAAPQPPLTPITLPSPAVPPRPGEPYPMAGRPPGGGELNPAPQSVIAPGVGPTPPVPPGVERVDDADDDLDVPNLPGRPGHRRPIRRPRPDMD